MSETREEIVRVEVLKTNELQVVLEGGGDADYQYVYREAKGVYWNNEVGAFRGTERIEWTVAAWFAHIVAVCRDIGVILRLGDAVEWTGVPEADKKEILSKHTT